MSGVLIADDHVVFADALAAVLAQRDLVVDGTVSALSGVVPAVQRWRPRICLLDRRFGTVDSLPVVPRIHDVAPQCKVLVLTADPLAAGAREALAAGASGYVQKTFGVLALVTAIERVLAGETVVTTNTNTVPSARPADIVLLVRHLTAREWECLAMLVDGRGTGRMAADLGVATTTVRTHVQSLLTKLGVHSRLEAVSLAARHSLLDDRNAVAGG